MPSLGFIGAGNVGSVLARLFAARGYRIAAIASRTHLRAVTLAESVGAAAVRTIHEVIDIADLTILAVPDDAIESVADTLSERDCAGKGVVHTSGAHSLLSLRAVAAQGAMTGSLHPVFPIANDRIAPERLRGVTFATESDHPRLTEWLDGLVGAAEGQAITLRPEHKALYHAALVLTSNYAVTLYAVSQQILGSLGASETASGNALTGLLSGTLDNLRLRGIPDALTGPLVRGDVGTIRANLSALDPYPDIKAAYIALAKLTVPLAVQRGTDTSSIESALVQQEGTWLG